MGSAQHPVRFTKDRVVVVTGANTGLGYEIAKAVAFLGATVILACRSEEKAEQVDRLWEEHSFPINAGLLIWVYTVCICPIYRIQAIQRMSKEFSSEKSKNAREFPDTLEVEVLKLDLASYRSVVQFVESFKVSGRKLHVLFLNAGMGFQSYATTENEHEMVLQVNYLSQFVLVAKLLPIMKCSGPDCRIILMASSTHAWCSFDLTTINYTGPSDQYPAFQCYARSKLYQVMQMYCMVRRLSGTSITVNTVNPGMVTTEFGRNIPSSFWAMRSAWWIIKTFGKTPANGAKSGINCVVNPDLAGVTGRYFDNFRRSTCALARNEENQEALWRKTFELVGQYITEGERAGMERT